MGGWTTTTTAYKMGGWIGFLPMTGIDDEYVFKLLHKINNEPKLRRVKWVVKAALEKLEANSPWIVLTGQYNFGIIKPFKCVREGKFRKGQHYIYFCQM